MSKKRIESSHFKAFRGLLRDFPSGEVWHEDSPDFWIHTPDHVLGIEHCLVQIPTKQKTPLQAIESQTDEIISVAQEHAELGGNTCNSSHLSVQEFLHSKEETANRVGQRYRENAP